MNERDVVCINNIQDTAARGLTLDNRSREAFILIASLITKP